MKKRLNFGHSLYMDNFYNSYELTKKLPKQETYYIGTFQVTITNTLSFTAKAVLKKWEQHKPIL